MEVRGLVVWEFENLGLYRSHRHYCEGASWDGGGAIYAEWGEAESIDRSDSRRMAIVRGIFRNHVGSIIISTGAPGPGPLEDIRLVRWVSGRLPACD